MEENIVYDTPSDINTPSVAKQPKPQNTVPPPPLLPINSHTKERFHDSCWVGRLDGGGAAVGKMGRGPRRAIPPPPHMTAAGQGKLYKKRAKNRR